MLPHGRYSLTCSRAFGTPFFRAAALLFLASGLLPGATLDYSRIEKAISEHNLRVAKQELDKYLQAEPHDARAHMLLGIVLDEQNQPDKAEQEFKEALRLQPDLAAAHINLGKHYARRGDLAMAAHEFDSAIHLDPDDATAHENFGLVLMAQGNQTEAHRQLQTAADLAPRQPSVLMDLLKAQLASRKFTEARTTVAKIAALAPPSVDPYAVLGAIQAEGGDFAGAIETLQKARAREPNSTDVQYNLGLAYYKSGDPGHALGILESSQKQSDSGEIENLLGQVYEDDRQYVKAARALQLAIDLEPANESYRFDFAFELLKHRSFDVASVASEQAVRDFPDSLRLRLIQGVSYFGRGLYKESVDTFFEAARRFPDAELPLYCLAQAAGVTGDRIDEIQALVAAYAERHPGQSWPYYFLGQLACQHAETTGRAEDIEKAGPLLRKSIELDPGYAEAHYQFGNLYSTLTRWRDAAEEYRKAIKLQPSMSEAHYRLARTYRHLGDSTNAQMEFQIHQRLAQEESERSRRDQDLQVFLYKLSR